MRVGRGVFQFVDLHAGHRLTSVVLGSHRFEQRRQRSVGIFTLTIFPFSVVIRSPSGRADYRVG
jgi:hypothetical protein